MEAPEARTTRARTRAATAATGSARRVRTVELQAASGGQTPKGGSSGTDEADGGAGNRADNESSNSEEELLPKEPQPAKGKPKAKPNAAVAAKRDAEPKDSAAGRPAAGLNKGAAGEPKAKPKAQPAMASKQTGSHGEAEDPDQARVKEGDTLVKASGADGDSEADDEFSEDEPDDRNSLKWIRWNAWRRAKEQAHTATCTKCNEDETAKKFTSQMWGQRNSNTLTCNRCHQRLRAKIAERKSKRATGTGEADDEFSEDEPAGRSPRRWGR